jgi:hypothetical protein
MVLWQPQRVEVAGALTLEHHCVSSQILDRKANQVKFN